MKTECFLRVLEEEKSYIYVYGEPSLNETLYAEQTEDIYKVMWGLTNEEDKIVDCIVLDIGTMEDDVER